MTFGSVPTPSFLGETERKGNHPCPVSNSVFHPLLPDLKTHSWFPSPVEQEKYSTGVSGTREGLPKGLNIFTFTFTVRLLRFPVTNPLHPSLPKNLLYSDFVRNFQLVPTVTTPLSSVRSTGFGTLVFVTRPLPVPHPYA